MSMSPGERVRNYYRKQGAEAEQERIIKVLDTAKGSGIACVCDTCTGVNYYIDQLIDLIKGEVK